MGDNDYSQVVVQAEGKELSLLTAEGVARWLEKQAKDEVISLRDARIEDAQKYDEKAGNVSPISRDATVNDAIDIFILSIEQNKPRIYALLITEHGTLTEMPLGIITPWNLLPQNLGYPQNSVEKQ
jgi:hypothetical protein